MNPIPQIPYVSQLEALYLFAGCSETTRNELSKRVCWVKPDEPNTLCIWFPSNQERFSMQARDSFFEIMQAAPDHIVELIAPIDGAWNVWRYFPKNDPLWDWVDSKPEQS
ncbi:MAG: hypothetical protein Kow00121_48280 [Elainellaceae cyanobacterium]